MWFFMNICYLMTLVTFGALLAGFFQSFLHCHILKANHVSFMILISILYFFTETLVIFFFVGTGVSIKEYAAGHKLDTSFHRRSISIKRKIYPPLLLNMLWMSILFILVGAVDTFRCPQWLYTAFFVFCILDYVRIKIIQNQCFRDNTAVILEMSGLKLKT